MTIDEIINGLNLTDGVKTKATKDLKELIKTNYVEKSKHDELVSAKTNLENQIKDRDKQLETLKKTAGNKEEFEQKIKELQIENKTAKLKYEQDLKNLKIDSTIKLKLSNTAQDVDIVASLIDKTKLIVSDDGTVTGLDEQINPLKQSKPFLFKNDKQRYEPKDGGNPINNPFSKEHFNLTEQGKLFRENPQQARALAQAAGVNIGGIN